MSKTLKQLCDGALISSGLSAQPQYFSSADQTVAYLANEVIRSLSKDTWQAMRKSGTITQTSATEYDLPSDLDFFVADTMNAQDQERLIRFPTNDSEWWYYQAKTGPNGLRYKMRISGDKLHVLNPQDGIDLIFEYITKNIVQSNSSSTPDKEEFSDDNDTCILDDEILMLDLRWRVKQQRGIEGWHDDRAIAERERKTLRGQEAGSRTLCFGMNDKYILPSPHYDLYQ